MEILTVIVSVPAIVAGTNLFKRLGVKGNWSTVIAVLLGVATNLAVYVWGDQEWFLAVATGLITGLAAAGLYDLTPGTASDMVLIESIDAEPVEPRRADEDDYAIGGTDPE